MGGRTDAPPRFQASDSAATLRIEVDPLEKERERDARARALQGSYVPRLRLLGCFIISGWLYLHLRFIDGAGLTAWWTGTTILFVHALASWIILDRFYQRRARFDLGLLFLNTDLLVWIYLIYLSGGEKSWLFILLSVRAADQSPTTFRRAFYFAHAGTLLYVLMMVFLHLRGESMSLAEGWVKASIIYGFNLYLSLAARASEDLRRKLTSAIRLAKSSVADLERNRERLTEAMERSAELERSLAQSQKLESLGEMAGGIAHDFNNTMMSALPWADLIATRYRDDPELQQAAKQIRGAVIRAREVTSQLLDFAQPKPAWIGSFDLCLLVERQLQTLRISLPQEITVAVRESEKPCMINADEAHFTQVITNLFLNARDAMPQGGTLSFHLRAAEDRELGHDHISPSSHVAIDVTDTGVGMDEATMSRVFDPFFTTKAFGQGTGLGLSVVHRVIRQSGGEIAVRSRPGHGSTFTIVLPRAGGVSNRKPEPGVEREDGPTLSGRRILVVDDDPSVRTGLQALLELEEADTEVCDSGRAALEYLARGGLPDAIILDLGMPEMSGAEVHARIRKSGSRVPVVISSGYGTSDRLRHLLEDERTFYLQKPYEREDLVKILERALGSTPSA